MTQPGRSALLRIGGWLTRHPAALPIAILIVGGAFRFYNLNWDNGYQLHPDERWIYMVLSGASGNPPISWPTSWSQFLNVAPCNNAPHCAGSPLDPHFFAYGSLPFYLLALIAGTLAFLGQHVPFLSSWADINTYGNLPTVGRFLSATLDLGTVLLVFLIGRRVFDYWTAVLAMAFSAFTVLDIQLSHFYAVDTVLTPLALATVLAALSMVQKGETRAYVLGGIAFGAALATKTTALLLVVPLGGAAVLAAWQQAPWQRGGSLRGDLWRHYGAIAPKLNDNLQRLLVAYLIGAVTFVICEPYAVLDRGKLLSDIAEQTNILVTNTTGYGIPYMVQYAHTTPYLYQLKNLVFWGMGLPLGLAACAGVGYFLVRNSFRLRPEQTVLLLWVLPYFLFVGRFFAKFNRYMLPVTPLMTLLGAALLIALARQRRVSARAVGRAAIAVVTSVAFLYSLAYMHIYANPNTRVAATSWIYSSIPAGTTIAVEGPWDDPLPLPAGALAPNRYHTISLDMYADELSTAGAQAKIRNITDGLTHAQYIIISSERMIRSIPRLPSYYPIATRYYELLQGNKLNVRLALRFQQHPELGPITVQDYGADESFHVYDHPDVRIYRRVAAISPATVAALLSTPPGTGVASGPAPVAAAARPLNLVPDTRLMLSKSQWAADQKGLSYDQMFPPNGFAMNHPAAVWFLLLELLGILAFPVAFVVLGNFVDRGFVIAKTFGVLILGYLVWIVVSLGLATYDLGVILVALALTGVASALLYARFGRDILDYVRTEWRRLLVGEAVFVAGFVLFVLLRSWYPDLGHQFSPPSALNLGEGRMGEKQMELAFLNAIVRSRTFPPYDPFFAHGYINYYYYGFFLVGTLCKLVQISPAIGFNLAIATFFSLLVGNVASVVLTLTRRAAPAVLAAIFAGVLGNLNGGWQLIRGLMTVATVHSSAPLFGGIADVLSGLQQAILNHQPLPPFDYWESTRIIPPVGGPITEFPYFTYLFADLHPHLIAYPMTACALALAVNQLGPRPRGYSFALWTAVAAIVLGAIAVTNPWDFPTYGLVLALGALTGAYVRGRCVDVWGTVRSLAPLVPVLMVAVLCYLPFKEGYQTVFSTGVGLVRDITPAMLGPGTMSSSDVHDALVTPLRLYLEHFGLFLFIIISYLVLLLALELRIRERWIQALTWTQFAVYYRERLPRIWRAARVARRMPRRSRHPGVDPVVVAAAVIIAGGLAVLQYFLLAFLILVMYLVGLALARGFTRLSAAQIFVLALLLVPLALSLGTQIFFVKDWLAGGSDFRMNTIFKFYNQSWLLFAVAAACSLHFFARVEEDLPDGTARDAATRRHRHAGTSASLHASRAIWMSSRRAAAGTQLSARPATLALAPSQPGRSFSGVAGGAVEAGVAEPESPDGTRVDRHAASRPMPPQRSIAGAGLLDLAERRRVWTFFLVVLLFAASIYTYAGTISRETVRANWLPANSVPFGLDGMAFMKVAYPGDYGAISWLNAHVGGAQVVAESGMSYYNWQSRVAQFTGLPDIFNGIHEGEQRWADEIDPTGLCGATANPPACLGRTHARGDDVKFLYDSPNPAEAWRVIRTYGVRYIYVGFSEKQCTKDQCFSRAGLAKFGHMVGHGLRVAYRSADTTIYEVTGS